jgi:predicted phosphatase
LLVARIGDDDVEAETFKDRRVVYLPDRDTHQTDFRVHFVEVGSIDSFFLERFIDAIILELRLR